MVNNRLLRALVGTNPTVNAFVLIDGRKVVFQRDSFSRAVLDADTATDAADFAGCS